MMEDGQKGKKESMDLSGRTKNCLEELIMAEVDSTIRVVGNEWCGRT